MENAILEGFIATWSLWNSYIPILIFNEDYFKEKIGALSPFWKFGFYNKFRSVRRKLPPSNKIWIYFFRQKLVLISYNIIFSGPSKHCISIVPTLIWWYMSCRRYTALLKKTYTSQLTLILVKYETLQQNKVVLIPFRLHILTQELCDSY